MSYECGCNRQFKEEGKWHRVYSLYGMCKKLSKKCTLTAFFSPVFTGNTSHNEMLYPAIFDFVAYKCSALPELPFLAIELDGKDHLENDAAR